MKTFSTDGEMLWYILAERKKLAGNNKYVFAGDTLDSHIVDKREARYTITEATGIQFTFHDLRRTFGTIANSLAIGSTQLKNLLITQ